MSQPLKGLVVGIDIDAVCADHNAAFRRRVAKAKGVPESELGDQLDWGYKSWGITDEEFMRIHQEGVRDSMFLDMPPIEGVSAAIKSMVAQGAKIRIITHRLYADGNHQRAVTDTVKWLDNHRIKYHDLCMIGDKPDVGADIYIDDAPHNIKALQGKTGKPVIIFDQPYNRDVAGDRVSGWEEIPAAVGKLTGRTSPYTQGVLFETEVEEDPLAKIDPRVRMSRKKDTVPQVGERSRLCGAVVVDGSGRCRRPVSVGGRCPYHQK